MTRRNTDTEPGAPAPDKDGIALVVGGSSGIGLETALTLAERGHRVVVAARDTARLGRAGDAAAGRGLTLETHPVDVTNAASVTSLFGHVESLGSLEICVNTAGRNLSRRLVAPPRSPGEPWRQHPEEEWREVVDLSLHGTFLVGRSAAGLMAQQGGGGVLVNVASSTWSGSWGQSAYAAAKAAVVSLTRSWALELADQGIRVVCVAPGVVEGQALEDKGRDNPRHARFMQSLRDHVPLRRFALESEIAEAVLYATSNTYTTGTTLEVHGGGFPARIT